MTNKPLFSVVIPALNEEKYLPVLLSDLAKQTFTDFEVIVVDGNSDDKTVELCHSFDQKLRLQVLISPVRNVSTQRNLGASKAQADWIIFMDADNQLPHYFLQGIKFQIERYPTVDLFTCLLESKAYTGPDKPLVELANIGIELYSKIKPTALGALIGARQTVWKKAPFNDTLKYSEDYAFITDAVANGFRFKILKQPRFSYSLRRFKKDGTLKSIRLYAQLNLQHMIGNNLPGLNPEYPMDGGSAYDDSAKEQISWFEQIRLRFSRLSENQKKKFNQMIRSMDL